MSSKYWIGLIPAMFIALGLSVLVLPLSTNGRWGLSYVTSDSMEPTLAVGDGFFVGPTGLLTTGDIVVFRPVILEAERVVHRVVAITPEGYVTRGDNTWQTDQDVGEPPVAHDRVIGRVVTWKGSPLRVPGLGRASEAVRYWFGRYLASLIGGLLVAGALLLGWDLVNSTRRRSVPVRLRVGHVYMGVSSLALVLLLLAMAVGQSTHVVSYLVTVSPGEAPDRVPVGQPGSLALVVENRGVVPVLHFSEGVTPARVIDSPDWIAPQATAEVRVLLPASDQPGWRKAYLVVHNYPPLMPRPVLAWLHERSPYLAMAGNLLVFGGLLAIGSRLIHLRTPIWKYDRYTAPRRPRAFPWWRRRVR